MDDRVFVRVGRHGKRSPMELATLAGEKASLRCTLSLSRVSMLKKRMPKKRTPMEKMETQEE